MGEVSGEVIAPPQAAKETKEAEPNFGLSVNGSQLIALANLNFLEKDVFTSPEKPNLLDRLKILKNRPARQKLNVIKKLILDRNIQEAKRLLKQSLPSANSALKSVAEDVIKQAIDALSGNVSVQDALKDEREVIVDHSYREFIKSLPGKVLNIHPPKNSCSILLTQLGSIGSVSLESNQLNLIDIPNSPLFSYASLPLDQQHPLYIEREEVQGAEGKETTLAKLEVFAELAKRYPKVFTHMARGDKFPTIIQSGHFGKDYGKDHEGNTQEKGLFAEELTFKDASEYAGAIKQLKSGKEIVIPWNEINPHGDLNPSLHIKRGYNYPLHELTYIRPANIAPVVIFSDQLPQEHKIQGWLIDGAINIKDKCLVGIWVTPQYKKHLLHWISTWTEKKRQEVFGDRKPEEILISSAKDLLP